MKIKSKSTIFSHKNFFEQIKILKRREGFSTWVQFEEAVGMRGASSRWKKGIDIPSAESLLKIAVRFDVSVDWLLTGKKPDEPKILQPIITIAGDNLSIPPNLRAEDYCSVPLVEGRIAAMYDGPIPSEFVQSLVWIYEPDLGDRMFHNLRAVRIGSQAHAMWRILRSRDIIIIDPLEKPPYKALSFKGIYAVRLDEEEGYGLRRVRETEDLWIFIADNPAYDSIQIRKTARDNPIIGQVIYAWRHLIFPDAEENTQAI